MVLLGHSIATTATVTATSPKTRHRCADRWETARATCEDGATTRKGSQACGKDDRATGKVAPRLRKDGRVVGVMDRPERVKAA